MGPSAAFSTSPTALDAPLPPVEAPPALPRTASTEEGRALERYSPWRTTAPCRPRQRRRGRRRAAAAAAAAAALLVGTAAILRVEVRSGGLQVAPLPHLRGGRCGVRAQPPLPAALPLRRTSCRQRARHPPPAPAAGLQKSAEVRGECPPGPPRRYDLTTHTAVPIRLTWCWTTTTRTTDDGEASGSSLASSVDERAWWYWFTMPHSSHEVASRCCECAGAPPDFDDESDGCHDMKSGRRVKYSRGWSDGHAGSSSNEVLLPPPPPLAFAVGHCSAVKIRSTSGPMGADARSDWSCRWCCCVEAPPSPSRERRAKKSVAQAVGSSAGGAESAGIIVVGASSPLPSRSPATMRL